MSSLTEEPAFDPGSDDYRLQTDWGSVTDPGLFVVEAVASVLNRDELDLQPLQNVVDVDSLKALMHADGPSRLTLEFEYENTFVRLFRTGQPVIEVP